jgi:hypothetical protein
LLLIHPHLGGSLVGRRLPQTCPYSSPDYNADDQENNPKSLQDNSREVTQGEGPLIFGDPGEGRRSLSANCWCYRLIQGLTPLAIVHTCVLAVFRQSVSLTAAQAFCDTGVATTIKCAGWPTYRTATIPIICPGVSLRVFVEGCGGRDTDEQTINTGP